MHDFKAESKIFDFSWFIEASKIVNEIIDDELL